MSAKTGQLVKVTFKFEREQWRVTVLQLPQGSKEPVLVFRAKHASFGDAMDAFEDWQRAHIAIIGRSA